MNPQIVGSVWPWASPRPCQGCAALALALTYLLIFLVPGIGVAESNASELLKNRSFEEAPENVWRSWQANLNRYSVELADDAAVEGQVSLRTWLSGEAVPNNQASVVQLLRAAPLRGRIAEARGKIRVSDVSDGYAGLWVSVQSESGPLYFDNMADTGVSGSRDWTDVSLRFPVAEEAQVILIGALHSGTGTAWFDDLSLKDYGPWRVSEPATDAVLSRIRAPAVAPLPRQTLDWLRKNAR